MTGGIGALTALVHDILLAGIIGVKTLGEAGGIVELGHAQVGTVEAGLVEISAPHIGHGPHGVS